MNIIIVILVSCCIILHHKAAALSTGNIPNINNDVHNHQSSQSNENNNDNEKQLRIAFVTGNSMKAREMMSILCDEQNPDIMQNLVDLRVVKVDLPEIQEVDTLAIAKHKAIQGAQLAGGPCVVEDTSLELHALGGMPGPYIKWFMQKLGVDGLHKILFAYEDKSATAVCTLAFCPYPHADPVTFTGKTRGKIREAQKGEKGWDAMFVPDDNISNNIMLSFAEMNVTQKNQVSHRGKAVRKWSDWLVANKDELWERQNGRRAIGHKGLDFKISFAEE